MTDTQLRAVPFGRRSIRQRAASWRFVRDKPKPHARHTALPQRREDALFYPHTHEHPPHRYCPRRQRAQSAAQPRCAALLRARMSPPPYTYPKTTMPKLFSSSHPVYPLAPKGVPGALITHHFGPYTAYVKRGPRITHPYEVAVNIPALRLSVGMAYSDLVDACEAAAHVRRSWHIHKTHTLLEDLHSALDEEHGS